jgi:hypothetical protein
MGELKVEKAARHNNIIDYLLTYSVALTVVLLALLLAMADSWRSCLRTLCPRRSALLLQARASQSPSLSRIRTAYALQTCRRGSFFH